VTDEAIPKLLIVYVTPSEEEPFTDWLSNLCDVVGRKRILTRIARLE
jgi:putative component of toxin-antitoxin plasmid stabilization module